MSEDIQDTPQPTPKQEVKHSVKQDAGTADKKDTQKKVLEKAVISAESDTPEQLSLFDSKPSQSSNDTQEVNSEQIATSKEVKGKEAFSSKPSRKRPTKKRPERKKKEIALTGDPIPIQGLIEIASKGYGFLRCPDKGYSQARDDVFVPPEYIRKYSIRHCMWISGIAKQGPKGLQLAEVISINDIPVTELTQTPVFEDLKAINPNHRISFESDNDCFNTRVLDLVSPIGRGQRGLIVAPPRSGKTTLLMDIAKSLKERHEDSIHPILLLIDERPEEVTEFKRSLPEIEMFSSSNDSSNKNHMRVAELCIERAKRLVEQGKHVFILMDSITRLARAYNRGAESGDNNPRKGYNNRNKGNNNRGYQSGGIITGALEVPRRLFAAARNTREAGSLTILATALVQTNSKADEAIFQEFKGTGNMEIVLDRRLADHYIYPAVDIFKSGTRREELILSEMTLKKFHLIRRGLKGQRTDQAMERLLFFLKKFPNNAQMLLEIKG